MASLSLRHIYKKYPGGVTAVSDFCLEIKDTEFIIFVGPSGCGKSTTLRMIAGLEEITEGELFIGDKLVNDIAPKDRDIAMVFQNYALYPHMTVFDNMAFGLKLRKIPKETIKRKVEEDLFCNMFLLFRQYLHGGQEDIMNKKTWQNSFDHHIILLLFYELLFYLRLYHTSLRYKHPWIAPWRNHLRY